MQKPECLLINPPVYDFALYDLFHRPYGLLRIGRWLKENSWTVRYLDCLDPFDEASSAVLAAPRRKKNGCGKFHRQPVDDLNLKDRITGSGAAGVGNQGETGIYAAIPDPKRGKPIARSYCRYGNTIESIRQRAGESSPDIIMITSGMTYWYPGVREAAEMCKNLFPGVPILLGGVYASLLPEHAKNTIPVDYVITGPVDQALEKPGEGTLSDILSSLGFPVPEVSMADIPDWEAPLWRGAGILRIHKGCPLLCQYCASRIVSGAFQCGSADAALESLDRFYAHGIRHYAFYDDALLVNREQFFIPFLENVIASYPGCSFYLPNAVHIRYLDNDTISLMMQAGFKDVRLGFESADPEFHRSRDGKVDLGDFRRVVDQFRRRGIGRNGLGVYILSGLPGQKCGEVRKSVEFAADLGVRVYLSEYSPVPGSGMWEESVANSSLPIAEEPLYQNNTLFPMEWSGFTMQELMDLKLFVRSLNAQEPLAGKNQQPFNPGNSR